MEIRKCSRLLACAGLLALALLSGCGKSSPSTSIPSTATIFYAHSAIFRNNSCMTMGYNGFGQLGLGNLSNQSAATIVPIGPVDRLATGGDHTLAVSFANISSVYAWGSNNHGQLGSAVSTSGSSAYSSTPVKVSLHGTVREIAAGGFHSLAVVDVPGVSGKVYGWGYNGYGQLGGGTLGLADSTLPVPVQLAANGDLNGIVQVAAGGSHSLALSADGRVYAWGSNAYGQLGKDPTLLQGSYATSADLVQVLDPASHLLVPLDHVVQVAAGGSTSYARQADGTVWAWGYNGMGQLGLDPSLANAFRYLPVQIAFGPAVLGGATIANISAGQDHVLARLSDGHLVAWGFNRSGQVGNNDISAPPNSPTDRTRIFVPVRVLTGGDAIPGSGVEMTGVTDIIASGNHSLAKVGSAWYGWGDNSFGQLGRPISSSSIGYLLVPQLVQGF